MNKAKLLHAKKKIRQDPKSLVLEVIPGLHKSFHKEFGKNCYWMEKVVGENPDGTPMTQLVTWKSLQNVIDNWFMFYPVLQPYADIKVIHAWQEEMAANKNMTIPDGEKTNQYWECGGCSEDFIHPMHEEKCSQCEDTREGAIWACIEDVILLGLPIDWIAHKAWKQEQIKLQAETDQQNAEDLRDFQAEQIKGIYGG